MIYLFMCFGAYSETMEDRNRQATLTEDKHTFVASDYYGDCTKTVLEVAVVLLTQFSLLVFYALGLYTSGTPDFSNGRVFAFYYAGLRLYTLSVSLSVVRILLHTALQ